MSAVRVFISYSHDTPAHSRRVLELANALRSHGVEVELDQYYVRPPQGWPRWCEAQLRPENASFVLVICTSTYKDRVEGKTAADEGRGVYWEGSILYSYLYDEKANQRFIPVLLPGGQEDDIPRPLKDATAEAERAAWQRMHAEARSREEEHLSALAASRDTLDRLQAVTARATKMFEWRVPSDSLLDIALDHLSWAMLRSTRRSWSTPRPQALPGNALSPRLRLTNQHQVTRTPRRHMVRQSLTSSAFPGRSLGTRLKRPCPASAALAGKTTSPAVCSPARGSGVSPVAAAAPRARRATWTKPGRSPPAGRCHCFSPTSTCTAPGCLEG